MFLGIFWPCVFARFVLDSCWLYTSGARCLVRLVFQCFVCCCLLGFCVCFPCSLSVPCSFTVGSFWQLFQWELRLFRGNPVLGLLGSSFLGFINSVSVRCDNPLLCVGWVLPFVASGRLLIFFCWVFGKNFGDSVGMLSWVCCALGFGVQMGWFRVRW